MKDKNIVEVLQTIQAELKAPKGQYNSFSKYKYRSCEDILEAVKPLLAKNGAIILLTDKVIDNKYIEATAILKTATDSIQTTAQAGLHFGKKGMDEAQIYGASSSYARKYALNGLLLIDDTKDADTQKAVESPPVAQDNTDYMKQVDAIMSKTDSLDLTQVLVAKKAILEIWKTAKNSPQKSKIEAVGKELKKMADDLK